MPKYSPTNAPDWPRFTGITTYARLPQLTTTEEVDFGIIGVPFDLGSSFRSGARFGPSAVREASRLIRLANQYHRINVYDYLSGGDYGDTPIYPSDIEHSIAAIEQFVRPIVKAGIVPLCIGGDHTISWPVLRALAADQDPLALVHFDAHTDTEDTLFGTKINHATPFRRAMDDGLIEPRRSIQIGIRGSTTSVTEIEESRDLGFDVIEADEMFRLGVSKVIERVRRRVGDAPAYLSFDIDFIEPAYAPGTGTPEVGGPTSREALELVRQLTEIDFVGFDLVEVLPDMDSSGITALLAANIIFEFISLLAVKRRPAERA